MATPQDRASRGQSSVGFLPAAAAATASAVPAAARGPVGRKAVRAVHGPVATRLEGHLGVLATLGAHRGEHLPLPALVAASGIASAGRIAAACLAGDPALGAPTRLVGEALLREELLLSLGEDEFLAAVPAGEGLVLHVDHADSQSG